MDWIGDWILPFAGIVFVYGFGKALGMHEAGGTIPEVFNRQGRLMLWGALLVQVFIATAALYLLSHSKLASPRETALSTPIRLLIQLSLNTLILIPFLTIKWKLKESWASTGVSLEKVGKALLIGFAAAFVYIVVDFCRNGLGFSQVWALLDWNATWALPMYAAVGFSEEWTFRGYVQPRFERWLGRIPGWLLTSLVMAFMHVPQRILVGGMPVNEALLSSLELLPISLLLGYMRMRTGTIWAPAILHTAIDWEGVFFGG